MGQIERRGTSGASKTCDVLAGVEPPLANGRGERLGRAAEIREVAVPVPCDRPPHLMVEVVGPDAVESMPAWRVGDAAGLVPPPLPPQGDGAPAGRADLCGELREEMFRARVDQRMGGVEPQAVDVVLVYPVQRVL